MFRTIILSLVLILIGSYVLFHEETCGVSNLQVISRTCCRLIEHPYPANLASFSRVVGCDRAFALLNYKDSIPPVMVNMTCYQDKNIMQIECQICNCRRFTVWWNDDTSTQYEQNYAGPMSSDPMPSGPMPSRVKCSSERRRLFENPLAGI